MGGKTHNQSRYMVVNIGTRRVHVCCFSSFAFLVLIYYQYWMGSCKHVPTCNFFASICTFQIASTVCVCCSHVQFIFDCAVIFSLALLCVTCILTVSLFVTVTAIKIKEILTKHSVTKNCFRNLIFKIITSKAEWTFFELKVNWRSRRATHLYFCLFTCLKTFTNVTECYIMS